MRRLATLLHLTLVVSSIVAVAQGSANCQTAAGRVATRVNARSKAPRILLRYDMEGLAGQDDWRTFSYWWPEEYAKGQRLLAADVNAVVEGLFAGGAASVDVWDAHGSGADEDNLPGNLLDKRARAMNVGTESNAPDSSKWDALALVAMHAKIGTGGFAAHTGTFGHDWIVNGRSLSESERSAYSYNAVGIPVIFITGDDRLGADMREVMPWARYVTTKYAQAPDRVRLRPVAEVHEEMRAQARVAVEQLASACLLRPSTPVRAAFRALPPASLAMMANIPGVTMIDGAVTFETPDWEPARRALGALAAIASGAHQVPISRELRNHPDARRAAQRALWSEWIELEKKGSPY